jgi:hypothetical protein
MILQIEFWQLAGMLGGLGVAIISCVIVLARWLAAEYDRRQGQRLDMFEEAAKLAAVAHTEALGKHVQEGAQEVARISGHAERIARLEEAIQRSPVARRPARRLRAAQRHFEQDGHHAGAVAWPHRQRADDPAHPQTDLAVVIL